MNSSKYKKSLDGGESEKTLRNKDSKTAGSTLRSFEIKAKLNKKEGENFLARLMDIVF